jgi:cystathionine gamma-lyase
MHGLPIGSKIICGNDIYGGAYRLFTTVFNKIHSYQFIDTTNMLSIEDAFKSGVDAIWLETPTNPMLKITDIRSVSDLAKRYNVKVYVDNTFMSPYFQKPLSLGADVVVHSMTKYINGHSDVVGGCLMTNNKSIHNAILTLQNSIGPSSSPFDSWLVLRGIKTLAIRMEAHQRNALKLSKWLETHSKVESVIYPGLESHPQYSVAKEQMTGFGGMITFFIKGGLEESKRFLERVKIFALAESLGGVESLIEHPAIMTHASIPYKIREEIGILDNLIRLSVGIEDIDDLINDLDKALD